MADISQINAKELGKFLLEAKRNTYASGKKAEKDIATGEKSFIFTKGQYFYEDNYFEDDPNPFIGHETVYRINKGICIPIWGMNYYGKFTEEGKKYPDPIRFINFLREALRANKDINKPFRGPSLLYGKGGLRYQTAVDGNIFNFKGFEIINCILRDDTLYHLNYHGGII